MDLKQQHEIRAGRFTVYSLLVINTAAISILIILSLTGNLEMTVPHLIRHFLLCQGIVLFAYLLVAKYGHLSQTKYFCSIFYAMMYTNDVVDITVSHEVWLVAFFILTLSTLYLSKWYIVYTTALFTMVQLLHIAIVPANYMKGGINIQEVSIRLAAFIFSGFICVLTTEWGSSFITRTIHESKRANTDPLTGIFNYGYLMSRLTEKLKQHASLKEPAAFLMLDIDFFKKVNDTHGHQYGDFVLKEIAFLISQCIRENDIFARYGGEEFSVILDAGEEDGNRIAERIRTRIEGTEFISNGIRTHVTVSIGVTVMRKNDTAASVIERADKNLYSAKQRGRNMVCRDELHAEIS